MKSRKALVVHNPDSLYPFTTVLRTDANQWVIIWEGVKWGVIDVITDAQLKDKYPNQYLDIWKFFKHMPLSL